MTQLWEAEGSTFQAREVRFVLSLALLKGHEELFRNLRGPSIGAQFCHTPRLPCHADGTLADMTEDHSKSVSFLRTFCPVLYWGH